MSDQLKTTDSPHFLVLFCLADAEDGQWAIARQWMPDQRDEAETHASRLIQCLPDGSQVVIAELRTYAIARKEDEHEWIGDDAGDSWCTRCGELNPRN